MGSQKVWMTEEYRELFREYEAAVEDYLHQLEHGGIGDIERAAERRDEIGAKIDAMERGAK